MKQMTWDDYYESFYDWSPSTRQNYAYCLSGYGPTDEVWEVAQELAFHDEAFATKFLKKALAAGARFTPDQVLEMVGTVEEPVLSEIAEQTDVPFDREQLEEIYMMIGDASFQRISRRAGIDVFDDEPAAYEQREPIRHSPPEKEKRRTHRRAGRFCGGLRPGWPGQEAPRRALRRQLRQLPAPLRVSLWALVLWKGPSIWL